VNLGHRAVERVELSASLVTFLEFTLEVTKDVVESETTLAGRAHASAHATHSNKPLRLHHRTTLATNGTTLTVEIERVTGTGGRGDVLMVT